MISTTSACKHSPFASYAFRPRCLLTTGLFALCLAACGGGQGQGGTPLVGTAWMSSNADGSAVAVELKTDGSYVLQKFNFSSSSTEDQVQKGVYALSESAITFVPAEWTCAGPAAVFTETYTLSGSVLTLTDSQAEVTFSPDSARGALGGPVSLFGCFTATGFVACPLAPVSN